MYSTSEKPNCQLSSTSNMEAALYFARQNIPVLPLCWPNRQGKCGCPYHHTFEQYIGKAPITLHGVDDATTDETQIRRWWTRYPQANIGGKLDGVLVIDNDSLEAAAEALNKGLPPGPTVKSGRADGGEHRYYLAPKWLTGTVVRKGESGSIDIKANTGYAILPPSLHRSGNRYEWLLTFDDAPLQDAPFWAVRMLLEAQKGKGEAVELPADLPKVDIDALRISERTKGIIRKGPDAEPGQFPSRSEAIMTVELAMIRAGYDDATIASVLLDPEYEISAKGREQGRKWLAGDIGRAHAKGGTDDHKPDIPLLQDATLLSRDDSNAALLIRIERLEAQLKEEREYRLLLLQVIRNPKIQQIAPTALTIAFEVESAASRGKLDEEGQIRLGRGKIALKSGKSQTTVSKQTQILEEHGIISKTLRYNPDSIYDNDTGELIVGPHKEQWIGLNAPLNETLQKLANLDPEKKQWGGLRLRCPEHPNAAQTVTTTCSECGRVLDIHEKGARPTKSASCNFGTEEESEPEADTKSARCNNSSRAVDAPITARNLTMVGA